MVIAMTENNCAVTILLFEKETRKRRKKKPA